MTVANSTFYMILMYIGSAIYLLALIAGIFWAITSKAKSKAKSWFIIGCSLLIFSMLFSTALNIVLASMLAPNQMFSVTAISSLVRGVILSGGIFAFGYAALGKHNSSRLEDRSLEISRSMPESDSNNPYR